MKILLKREKVAGERAAIFDGEFSGKKLIKYQIMIFPLIFTKFLLCISFLFKLLKQQMFHLFSQTPVSPEQYVIILSFIFGYAHAKVYLVTQVTAVAAYIILSILNTILCIIETSETTYEEKTTKCNRFCFCLQRDSKCICYVLCTLITKVSHK